jgi:hypothetical protein
MLPFVFFRPVIFDSWLLLLTRRHFISIVGVLMPRHITAGLTPPLLAKLPGPIESYRRWNDPADRVCHWHATEKSRFTRSLLTHG